MPSFGELFRRVMRRPSRRKEPDTDWRESRTFAPPDEETDGDAAASESPTTEEIAARLDSPAELPPESAPDSPAAPPVEERLAFQPIRTPDTAMADPQPHASSVATPAAPTIVSGDDVLHDDYLLAKCPYCGLEDQRVGSRCLNQDCNQVIVRIPPWAQRQRQNRLTRRFSWRGVIMAGIIGLLIVFVVWINYPFAPNPSVVFKKTMTQMTTDTDVGSWAAAGRDLRHSRYVAAGPPPPAGQIRSENATVPGEPLASEPVAQGNHIYVGSTAGIYALAHNDLSAVKGWEGNTPGRITGSAAVVDAHLFFGSTDHTINSWDAYDGEVHWSYSAADTVEVSPVVANGLVFIGSGEGWMYALDAYSGREIWRAQLESNASDAVAVHDGRLYVGDEKGMFYVLSAKTGQEWFRYRTPRAITGSPVVSADGQRAYFAAGGRLYAVEARKREVPGLYQFKQVWAQLWLWQVPGVPRPKEQQGGLWRFIPKNPLQGLKSSPALAGGENGETVYAGGHDGVMYALDALTGSERWTFQAPADIWASPVAVKDQLIFGDNAGNLYSLNRDDGTVKWNINLGSGIRIPPVVSNGLLIVRTRDGTIFGIE